MANDEGPTGIELSSSPTFTFSETAGDLLADQSPGSPGYFVRRLLSALVERAKTVKALENWYDGRHPLPGPPARMSEGPWAEAARAFRNLSRMGVTNYLPLIVDAPADRLRVLGFRFGDPETKLTDDRDGWSIWQRAKLDADGPLVQHTALKLGDSFLMVWPGDDGKASITPEYPSQTIVAYRAGSRRDRIAALKHWVEDDGTRRVVLYLPELVYKWSAAKGESAPLVKWQPDTDDSWPIANPLAPDIPIVELRANADLRPAPFGGGCSEFERVISIQERINKTVFDRLVTAEFQAFRQRWATGYVPADANEAVKMGSSSMLYFPPAERGDEPVRVGEFAQADFKGFLDAVGSDVQAMAAITRTPTFYTLGAIENISGDALTALQGGLVAKCETHRDNFGETYEEALDLALRAEGNPRAGDVSSEVIWRSIEHVSWAERADAAVKMAAANVPDEAVWTMLGFSPQEIARFKVQRADAQLFAPPPPAVPSRVSVGPPPGPGRPPALPGPAPAPAP